MSRIRPQWVGNRKTYSRVVLVESNVTEHMKCHWESQRGWKCKSFESCSSTPDETQPLFKLKISPDGSLEASPTTAINKQQTVTPDKQLIVVCELLIEIHETRLPCCCRSWIIQRSAAERTKTTFSLELSSHRRQKRFPSTRYQIYVLLISLIHKSLQKMFILYFVCSHKDLNTSSSSWWAVAVREWREGRFTCYVFG